MAKKVAKDKITTAPKATAPRNIIVSYDKIDDKLKSELKKKYPDGFTDYLRRYPKPNGEFFFAVPLDIKDMHYLIKIEAKVDNLITEEDFDKYFGDASDVDDKEEISEVEIADDDTDDEDNDDEALVDEDDD